jgi:hypothetical protein
MAIPLSYKLEWVQANPLWASTLNPIIANPLNGTTILKSIELTNGVTVVNHLLGRLMQGWFIVDINAAATIYRSQPMNNLTLTLTSSAAVTVNIGVF